MGIGVIHMPTNEDFLAESEEVTYKAKAGNREVIVTDRRLIVHDVEREESYFVDAMLSRIASIQAFRRTKPSYLIGAGISITCGVIFFMLSDFFFSIGLADFFEIIGSILFFVAIGLIIAYFLTIRHGIYMYIDSADPISIVFRGKASSEIVKRLSKAIRHRKQDLNIKSS